MVRLTVAFTALLLCFSLLAASADPLPAQAAAPGTTVVYITKTGTRYHVAGCSYLKKSKIKTTLAEAKKNKLKPCKKCKPPT